MTAKAKLLLSISLMFSVVIIAIASFGYLKFKDASVSSSQMTLKQKSFLISNALDQKMNRMFDALTIMQQHIKFDGQANLIDVKTSNSSLAYQDLLDKLESLKKHFNVLNAYIGIKDGSTYSINKNGLIPNFNAIEKKREWYVRAFEGDKKIITTPYTSASGNLVMAVAVPIIRQNNVIGVLSINLPLDEITKFVTSLDTNNQVYASRSDGFVLSANNADFIGTSIFEHIPEFKHFNDISSDIHEYTYNDEDYLVITAASKEFGWVIWAWEPMDNIAAASNNNLISSILIAAILIVLSLFFVYLLVHRLMYIPIGGEPKEIEAIVKKVASGDLTSDIQLTGKETGIFSEVILMTQSLRKIMSDINQTASFLDTSSSKILDSANQVNERSKSQMQQLEHAVNSMNEMTMTVDEIAKHAVQAESSADTAHDSVEGGTNTVNDMNTSITELVKGIEEVQTVIIELDNETTSVGSILDVIRGISEQTNLLALNAAIEAARAGDTGRGFAVVADEVRELANKTKNSTDEIQGMITTLQSAAKSSVNLMQKNANSATDTGSKSDMANDALLTINQSTIQIKEMNSSIATAAEEQATVAQLINTNIDEINELAKLTSSNSDQNKTLASEISQAAKSLKESVNSFKI